MAKELDRLQELGVITPVTHSEWAAPIVLILKGDGSIRLCGDYKVTVNPVLLIDSYPLPRIEDLFASLSGGTVFSKLVLKHAYLQVPLDEESKKYTTINTFIQIQSFTIWHCFCTITVSANHGKSSS